MYSLTCCNILVTTWWDGSFIIIVVFHFCWPSCLPVLTTFFTCGDIFIYLQEFCRGHLGAGGHLFLCVLHQCYKFSDGDVVVVTFIFWCSSEPTSEEALLDCLATDLVHERWNPEDCIKDIDRLGERGCTGLFIVINLGDHRPQNL